MITPAELEDSLSAGYELRRLELKGPGDRTDKRFFAKVVRAALSMGNVRDGGHVVVGIDDANSAAMLPGLDGTKRASWLVFDELARNMAQYCDPPLRFEIEEMTLSSGADVVVMHISEFADLPHLCARDYPGVLRRGALYVRTRSLPETAEIGSSVEMRELLDLATEKALRAYVETAERAGLRFAKVEPTPDREWFAAQRRRAFE